MARAMSCPRCNKRLPGEANFCRRCGTGLRGRSAPAFQPPLVSTGYGDAAADWRGASEGGVSPVLGYEAAGRHRRKPPRAVPPRAPAFSVRGWWLFILLGIFAFRACDMHPVRWNSSPDYRSAPRMRPAPRQNETPPVREDDVRWSVPDDRGRE